MFRIDILDRLFFVLFSKPPCCCCGQTETGRLWSRILRPARIQDNMVVKGCSLWTRIPGITYRNCDFRSSFRSSSIPPKTVKTFYRFYCGFHVIFLQINSTQSRFLPNFAIDFVNTTESLCSNRLLPINTPNCLKKNTLTFEFNILLNQKVCV